MAFITITDTRDMAQTINVDHIVVVCQASADAKHGWVITLRQNDA